MASPVDTSVKHYRSDISTSLVLNGQAGSLIGLLDACLVNGYGLQTATSLVVADGVATATFASPFAADEDMVVLVAGATPAGLNGEQRLTSVGPNSVSFATDEPDGTATGTITVKIAAAGWAKAFSGTNKAVYRSLDVQAHGGGMCLRVADAGVGSPQYARVVAYENMTDVDTGTNPFPTNAQVSGGLYWHKSGASSANSVNWAVVADSRFLILHVSISSSTPGNMGVIVGTSSAFGDLLPLRVSGDPFAVLIAGRAVSGYGSEASGLETGALTGKYVARPYTGLGNSTPHTVYPYVGGGGYSGADSSLGPFPNPITGALMLSRRYAAENQNQPARADVPGILHSPQNNVANAFNTLTKVFGTGEFEGRKLLSLPASSTGLSAITANACAFVDITGPWR